MFQFLLLIFVLCMILLVGKVIQKRISPQYYLDVYFGVPGVGKTTVAAYLARNDLKKKKAVWSNVPIVGAKCLFPEEDIGKYLISNGRVIIDEAGIQYNNRNFKKFSNEATEFFKLHRHYKLNISVFSQGYNDFDKKIRDLAQRLYILKASILPFFIVSTRIRKKIGINELTKDIVDEYYLSRFEFKLIFSPPLWKLFSSWDHPSLPEKEWLSWK